MSLETLKRSNSLDKLLGAVEKENAPQEKKSYKDERLWKPELDKSGNGYAVIRFLPAVEGEDMPWARVYNHAFQGPTGQWYIENSLTTINQDDPVSEFNSKLWNSGIEADKDQARKQRRRLKYTANVYIVKDSANPANEGKVFLYQFGKKIFDKLNDLMNPQFEDEAPVNPFDLWDGANFRLKIRQFEGYPNYDKSEFDSQEPLFDDDDELESTWKKCHSLQELVDPKNFKSYAELKAKLHRVLGVSADYESVSTQDSYGESSDEFDLSSMSKSADAPKIEEASYSATTDDDDDDLSIFKELAKG